MNKTVSDNEAKLQHSIYRLNYTKLFKQDFNGDVKSQLVRFFEAKSAEELSEKGKTDSDAQDDQKFTGYVSCDLKSDIDKKGFDGIFLYKEEPRSMDEMNNFITSVTGKDLHFKEKMQYSTLLILWKEENFYAITTGAARFTISEYIEHHFGLKLMSNFKDKISVRSKCTNPLYGNVHEEEQKLASSVPISCVVSSDSLLSKITGHISQDSEILRHLGLPATGRGKNNVQIFARDHIRISPKLSFVQLLELLDKINTHNCKEDTINMIVQEEGNACNKLAEWIYDCISKNDNPKIESIYIYPEDDADFEVSPKWKVFFDVDIFLEVDRGNIVEICKKCIERFFNNVSSVENIEKILNNASIEFGEGKKHRMIDVLNGEVEHKGKIGSLIYGRLYSFSSNMKGRIESILKARLLGAGIDDENGRKNLGEENLKFIENVKYNNIESEEDIIKKICKHNKNAYPLHEIILSKAVAKIEFADILIDCEDALYIVHVKREFNQCIRDLEKQMEMSYYAWNDIRTHEDSIIFDDLWSKIENCAKEEAKKQTYKGKRAKKCSILKEKGKQKLKMLLQGNSKKVVYVALIGVKKSFKGIVHSGSITAQLCLERLISFFHDVNIEVRVMLIDYEAAAKINNSCDAL